ncbi:MAG: hypothetical protein ACPG1A_04205 [Halioglobus sp.]
MKRRYTLAVCMALVSSLALSNDINGFWKHPEGPGWIEIDLAAGKGTVVRNDEFPEREGREIITGLKADPSKDNVWHAQVYAERLGEYKKARISLLEPDLMEFRVKVGFVNRSIEWVRVDEVPAAAVE